MSSMDYKAAYERQKAAREQAEQHLEDKSRELYEANQSLLLAYNRLRDQKSQILHQEKLATIGQLAAGVAHEINNPTGFVKSNLNSLTSYLSKLQTAIESYESLIVSMAEGDRPAVTRIEDIRRECDVAYILEDAHPLLNESIEGLDRIQKIVEMLKNFSRPDKNEDEKFSINECIQNTLHLVHNEIKYKADVKLHMEHLPEVTGKPGAISQVILNLLVNAADAIEGFGNIEVNSCIKNDEIKVTVKDNGQGIPQNHITRIFDPFFTTKDVGKGTGLGLAVSRSIVKNHGGRLSVDSKEGEGSSICIHLPMPGDA